MATASPSEVVLDLARSRPPTLGPGRLVCVDGPSGSGKTTLAGALAERTGAQVVHTDDLMEGWRGLDAVGRQLTELVTALAEGRTGTYRRWDWLHDRWAARAVDVPPAEWLVVEGVGSGAPALAAVTTVLVWVEVDDELRLARALARDGARLEPQLRQFMVDERALFARDHTRERADVRLAGD